MSKYTIFVEEYKPKVSKKYDWIQKQQLNSYYTLEPTEYVTPDLPTYMPSNLLITRVPTTINSTTTIPIIHYEINNGDDLLVILSVTCSTFFFCLFLFTIYFYKYYYVKYKKILKINEVDIEFGVSYVDDI